jgi:hypothetical protein
MREERGQTLGIAGRLLAGWAFVIAAGLSILTVASFLTDRSA